MSEDKQTRRFRIVFPATQNSAFLSMSGVYYLRKGGFKFCFVEEGGKLKVLTLGYELWRQGAVQRLTR